MWSKSYECGQRKLILKNGILYFKINLAQCNPEGQLSLKRTALGTRKLCVLFPQWSMFVSLCLSLTLLFLQQLFIAYISVSQTGPRTPWGPQDYQRDPQKDDDCIQLKYLLHCKLFLYLKARGQISTTVYQVVHG